MVAPELLPMRLKPCEVKRTAEILVGGRSGVLGDDRILGGNVKARISDASTCPGGVISDGAIDNSGRSAGDDAAARLEGRVARSALRNLGCAPSSFLQSKIENRKSKTKSSERFRGEA
jgi:hypothetical protein